MKIKTLEQIQKDMESGIYDFTVNGECSSCGQCCSNYLPLSSKEIKEIHRQVKKHKIKEQIHNPPTSEQVLDMTCPFRDDANRVCLIYKFRPQICKSFRCDYPKRKIQLNKELFHGKYNVVDMRREFFNEK